ncbi:hypothetical protein PO909_033024 [Leuciscus waleckii]
MPFDDNCLGIVLGLLETPSAYSTFSVLQPIGQTQNLELSFLEDPLGLSHIKLFVSLSSFSGPFHHGCIFCISSSTHRWQ